MTVAVDIQIALDETNTAGLPDKNQIEHWIEKAVEFSGCVLKKDNLQITVRVVEEEEIARLNKDFRHKEGVTNVLSFPFLTPPGIPESEELNSLGDIAICASVVEKEAAGQNKTIDAHWAHIMVHGTLHLLGYDHQIEQEASEMEALEIRVLADLGYPDPYK